MGSSLPPSTTILTTKSEKAKAVQAISTIWLLMMHYSSFLLIWSWNFNHRKKKKEKNKSGSNFHIFSTTLLLITFLTFSLFIPINSLNLLIMILNFLLYIILTYIYKYELFQIKYFYAKTIAMITFKPDHCLKKSLLSTLKLTPKFISWTIIVCLLIAKVLSNIFMGSNIANTIIISDISINTYGNNSYLLYEPYFNPFNGLLINKSFARNFCYSNQRLKSDLFKKRSLQNDNEMILRFSILLILTSKLTCLILSNKIAFLIFLRTLKMISNNTQLLEESFHSKLKLSSNKEFFYIEVHFMDGICSSETNFNIVIFSLREMKCSNHSMYFQFLLMLAGDLELNPGPCQSLSLWSPFKKKGLHFVHLNINSIFLKIDELREIARNVNAAVIDVTESKLDSSLLDTEIDIEGYDLLRNDRNRHGGGVACYIRKDISFNVINDVFSKDIENIMFDILLPKTKPFTVGIFYRPPNQNNFVDKISIDFNKLLPEEKEIYFLGDFNINILFNGKSILDNTKNIDIDSPAASLIAKQYNELCSLFSLKQLIKEPTRITSSSSTLIDHILTNSTQKISQSGVIDTTLSDHQMVYCTRKALRMKTHAHKQIKCRSFKDFTVDIYLNGLKSSNFPNYENF